MTRTGRHGAPRRGHRSPTSRWKKRGRILSALLGFLLTGTAAFAVSNWVVGLNNGSNGLAQAGTVSNLTIAASASPAPGNTLYPGGNGDVVITITNPNSYPVTITALNLPTSSTYAAAYPTSALNGTPTSGCDASSTATSSGVTYRYATGTSGTSHTLTTALVVAASGQPNNPLTVTLTNDAAMAAASPNACAGQYFSMPSFTGVTATVGGTPVTTSPATDAWTA